MDETQLYKYQVVNSPPPNEVMCPVCKDILEEPHQFIPCGHHICKKCGDDLQQDHTTPVTPPCPVCKRNDCKMVPDAFFERSILNKLLIKCNEGCGKEMELGERKYHLETCPCLLVECEFSHVGCQEKVSRRDLAQHLSDDNVHHTALSSKMIHLVLNEVKKLREENIKLKELVSNIHDKVCGDAVPIFRMKQFAHKKVSKDQWYSPPYFTHHTNGYRMCFQVDFDDDDELYIYSCVMKGPYDDSLQWPFKGKVIVRLLNQCGVHDHHDFVFDYRDSSKGERVTDGERGEFYLETVSKCISYDQLDYNADTNCQYLQDDCLKFKVIVPSLQ